MSRPQRVSLLLLEIVANTLVVALTLGTKQNDMLQIIVVCIITVAIVKLLSFPIHPMFSLVNTFESYTLSKHGKLGPHLLYARLSQAVPAADASVFAHWAALWRFHHAKATIESPRRRGGLPWQRSAGATTAWKRPAPIAPPAAVLAMPPLSSPTKRSPSKGKAADAAVPLLAPCASDTPFVPSPPPANTISGKRAIVSVFATLQALVGTFAIAFGLFLVFMASKLRVAVVVVLCVAGAAVAIFGLIAFVALRYDRVQASIACIVLSMCCEVGTAILLAFAGFKAWRVVLLVVGTAHACLLAVALFLAVRIIRGWRKSVARQYREWTALQQLQQRITAWQASSEEMGRAAAAARVIVQAIR